MKKVSIMKHIMEMIDINGKELAMELGTDTTTVSKWRNKKRKLLYQSPFSYKIAKLFLERGMDTGNKRFKEYMEYEIPDFTEFDREGQIERLRRLLCDEEKYVLLNTRVRDESIQHNAYMQVFSKDFEGWKTAQEMFWKNLSESKKITVCDFGDVNWDKAEEERIDIIIEYIKEYVAKGGQVMIIDVLHDGYEVPRILFRWISLYMTEGVEIRYVMRETSGAVRSSYYCSEKEGVLVGHFDVPDEKLHVYAYHYDKQICDYYRGKTKIFLEKSQSRLKRMDISDNLRMVQLMVDHLSGAEITYMVNPSPTYINMTVELLCKVLKENDVTGDMADICIEISKRRHELRKRCQYVQLYDIDRIEERLIQERSRMDMLSIVVGRDIYISKELFIEQLKEMIDLIEQNEMTIILESFERLGIQNQKISLTAQENRIFLAWDDSKYNSIIHSEELSFVGGVVNYIRNLIEQVHPMHRKEDWTLSQLKKYTKNTFISK